MPHSKMLLYCREYVKFSDLWPLTQNGDQYNDLDSMSDGGGIKELGKKELVFSKSQVALSLLSI